MHGARTAPDLRAVARPGERAGDVRKSTRGLPCRQVLLARTACPHLFVRAARTTLPLHEEAIDAHRGLLRRVVSECFIDLIGS